MKTRLWIAAMIYPIVNAMLFGFGVVPLTLLPRSSELIGTLFPWTVAVSAILALPISWLVAPRLRLRYWRKREAEQA